MNKPLLWYVVLSLYSPSASKLSSKSLICPRFRLGQMFTFRTISQPRACITQHNIPRKWFIHKILPYIYIILYYIISYHIISYHIIYYYFTLYHIFFSIRQAEHEDTRKFSEPARHSASHPGHTFQWKILAFANSWILRRTREAIFIAKLGSNLNK